VIAAAWMFAWQGAETAAQHRSSLDSRYAPIKRIKEEIQVATEQTQEIQRREKTALALAARRSTLSLLGSVSAAAQQNQGRVYVNHFNFRGGGDITDENAQTLLQLRGIGQDDAAVTRFVEHLRAAKLFGKVELKSSGAARLGDIVVREFQVECTAK